MSTTLSPTAPLARAPLPVTLDSALAGKLPAEVQQVAALFQMLGEANGLALAKSFADVSSLLKLQQIKESELYAAAGFTWEDFCRALPGRPSRRTIDERLLELEDLGAEFMQLAGELGLQRRTLRALRAVDADARPKLLESGEVEFPDGRRVPLDADHHEELREAMSDLAGVVGRLQEQLQDGVAQVREITDELTRTKNELLEAQKRGAAAELSPVEEAYTRAFRETRLLVDTATHGEADPALALTYFRELSAQLEPLLQYGLAAGGDQADDDAGEFAGAENLRA